ncbi:MAG: SDR family NAD(P)-dependent oxidoreductase, partial [Proteobacteria bacterium]|nr:SDR family NAD(P)-dependent oxidoreductase [Pseudomonadota bacterium]
MRLKDKVAIVTGASRGIGRGIALVLAKEGAHVVVASRSTQKMDWAPGTIYSVAEEIKALGRKALPIPTDVTREKDVQRMVEKTVAEFGRIDILVNNAGIILNLKPIYEVTREEWESILAVDLTGTFLCCKYVIPEMIKQLYGKIINMGSLQGRQGLRGQAAYGMCKAAIHNFTLALAKDVSAYDINVNCVGPGAVKTYLMESVFKTAMNAELKETLMKAWYENCSLFGREVTDED